LKVQILEVRQRHTDLFFIGLPPDVMLAEYFALPARVTQSPSELRRRIHAYYVSYEEEDTCVCL
jgi:hypothetical protein